MKNKYGFQNSCMGFSFYQLKLSVNQLSGITVLKCPFKRVIFHEMFNLISIANYFYTERVSCLLRKGLLSDNDLPFNIVNTVSCTCVLRNLPK